MADALVKLELCQQGVRWTHWCAPGASACEREWVGVEAAVPGADARRHVGRYVHAVGEGSGT
jgi:hypothetical protein